MEPDFTGYATKYDVRCDDGVIIRQSAFEHQDGDEVPIFWRHGRRDVTNVLGTATFEHRPGGLYTAGYFNNTPAGQHAREMVRHGDIQALSIFADSLHKRGSDVLKGQVREVSLVLKGANPGAYIDSVNMNHGDGDYDDGEGIIYTGLTFDTVNLSHEDDKETSEDSEASEEIIEHTEEEADMADEKNTDTKEKTVEQLYNEQSSEVKDLIAYMVGLALEEADDGEVEQSYEDDGEYIEHDGRMVNYNIFEQDDEGDSGLTLSHEAQAEIFEEARKYERNLKDVVLQHAAEYGIEDIEMLFPEARALNDEPELWKRRTEWVNVVLSETSHSPFAKVKTVIADVTEDEARAKGYIKGRMKKDEFFKLKKRETTPGTIYKKQKLDRDDVLDITSFDVVQFIKKEMRIMLDEEIARAILIGDGRDISDEDKISEPDPDSSGKGIRSILNDHDFYSHKIVVPANVTGGAQTEAIIRGMNEYRGTGTPTLFTSRTQMTDMLLEKDKLGRRLYSNLEELASVLQVSKIVPVDVMSAEPELIGIVVNLRDYRIGTNKGGEVSLFDDFDIDYNQMKYLLETRLSGGLTLPKSALVIKRGEGTQVIPTAPSFNAATNTITIPSVTGVTYQIDDNEVTGTVTITEDTTVEAIPAEGYFFVSGIPTTWTFAFNEG